MLTQTFERSPIYTRLEGINRVLVVRPGALGDLIISTSVMDAIRAEYGDHVLFDWVCKPGQGTIFKNDPRVQRVFSLKHKRFPLRLSLEKQRIVSASKSEPYDLVINFDRAEQLNDLMHAVVARHKFGPPYHHPALRQRGVHIVRSKVWPYAPIVNASHLEQIAPRLFGTPADVLQKRYNLPEHYLVINASNSHVKKQKINYRAWPQPYWKELIEVLAAQITLVMISGPGEEKFFKQIRPFPANTIDLTGKTPLPDLIGIINHAAAIVTTDTGPGHLASAVKTPVFALIGPTPYLETGPYAGPDNEVHILRADMECAPCYHTPVMEACRDNVCMKRILPTKVAKTISSWLDERYPATSRL